MEVKNYFAFTAENKPIPFCTAYLYEAGTSNLVSGLTDKNGNPISNPFQADKDGLVQFSGPNGVYDLRFKSSLRDYRIRISIVDTDSLLAAASQAADSENSAIYQAQRSESAADRSESFANISLASNNTFATVAAGEAATVDGDVFLVATADPSVYSVYENITGDGNFLGALDIASSSEISSIRDDFTNVNNFNLFPAAFLRGDVVSPPMSTRGTFPEIVAEWTKYNGYHCLHVNAATDTDTMTYFVPVSALGGATAVSVSVIVEYASNAGDTNNKISVAQYDASWDFISLDSTAISNSEIATPTRYAKEAVAINPLSAFIAFDLVNDQRDAYYRDFNYCPGDRAVSLPPFDLYQKPVAPPILGQSKNFFIDPFFRDTESNWTFGSNTTAERVIVDGVPALRVTGTTSENGMTLAYNASLFESGLLYFRCRFLPEFFSFSRKILSVIQLDGDAIEIDRHEITFGTFAPKDGIYVAIDALPLLDDCVSVKVAFYGADSTARNYYEPVISDHPIEFFSTDYYLKDFQKASSGEARFLEYKILPDIPGGPESGGWTCTGIDRITRGAWAGCWLIGSDGRIVEDDGSPYDPKVVVVTPDFSRVVTILGLGYTGASVQGVSIDTSGSKDTFWLSTATNGTIKHYQLYGNSGGVATEIAADEYDWFAEGHGGNPNGVAYVADLHAIWVGTHNASTARLISCDPASSPRQIDSMALAVTTPDQFQYDADDKDLLYTRGNNGSNGHVYKTNVDTKLGALLYTNLQHTQAMEGVYRDKVAGRMYLLNNGRFHDNAEPTLNIVSVFLI